MCVHVHAVYIVEMDLELWGDWDVGLWLRAISVMYIPDKFQLNLSLWFIWRCTARCQYLPFVYHSFLYECILLCSFFISCKIDCKSQLHLPIESIAITELHAQ